MLLNRRTIMLAAALLLPGAGWAQTSTTQTVTQTGLVQGVSLGTTTGTATLMLQPQTGGGPMGQGGPHGHGGHGGPGGNSGGQSSSTVPGGMATGSGTATGSGAAGVTTAQASTLTVTVSASTQILKVDGTTGAISDLTVGATVRVEGSQVGLNALAASKITIVSAGGSTVSGSATVTAVNARAASFTAQPVERGSSSVTVVTNSTTRFVKSDGSAATFADLAAGGTVTVQGSVSSGVIVASTVTVSGATVSGRATVTAVDARTGRIQVRTASGQSATVTVSNSTRLVHADGSAAAPAEIAAGATVEIHGTASSGGVTAQQIVVQSRNQTSGQSNVPSQGGPGGMRGGMRRGR